MSIKIRVQAPTTSVKVSPSNPTSAIIEKVDDIKEKVDNIPSEYATKTELSTAKDSIIGGASTSFDTLKEVEDWIDAALTNSDIDTIIYTAKQTMQ